MSTTLHPVAAAFTQIEADLNAFYLEREDAVRAMILAVLSGEHVFLLGPPGTGKSAVTRNLVQAVTGARHFECALSKTRPAEAVLGPLDLKEFRESGNYKLKRNGYASQVEFAFFDEIGKASPVLGHDMLALLNERVFHEVNGDRSVHEAPLSTAFTASNEMITDESDDGAALWDRLLFRVLVDHLKDPANFAALLTGGEFAGVGATVAWDDLKGVIDNEVPKIPLSDAAIEALVKLRKAFAAEHLYPSDRRWKASIRALQANAFMEGRDEVSDEDLQVLRFTLWDTVEQIDKVQRLCLEAANPFVKPLMEIKDALDEIQTGLDERSGAAEMSAYHKEVQPKLAKARDRLDNILMEAQSRKVPGFKKVSDFHVTLLKRLFKESWNVEDDVLDATIAKMRGMGDGEKGAPL